MISGLNGRSWETNEEEVTIGTDDRKLLMAIVKRDLKVVKELAKVVYWDNPHLLSMAHLLVVNELRDVGLSSDMHEIIKVLHAELRYDLNTSEFKKEPVLYYYLIHQEPLLAEELVSLGADVNIQVATRKTTENEVLFEPLIYAINQKANTEREDYELKAKQLWEYEIDINDLITRGRLNPAILRYPSFMQVIAQKALEAQNNAVNIQRQVDWLRERDATIIRYPIPS